MSKKSFTFIAILFAAMFAACQPNPTPINSTYHKPETNQNSTAHSETGTNEAVHSTANYEAKGNTQTTNAQPGNNQMSNTQPSITQTNRNANLPR